MNSFLDRKVNGIVAVALWVFVIASVLDIGFRIYSRLSGDIYKGTHRIQCNVVIPAQTGELK